jgi:hypothetical protein
VALVIPVVMLMTMMSSVGIGGVCSAVARGIGAERSADANALVLHPLVLAVMFVGTFTIGVLVSRLSIVSIAPIFLARSRIPRSPQCPLFPLSGATVVTQVKVTVDPVEVATEEVKEEEHQPFLGFIPNFYVTYRPDAAPLTTKLKYQLAWKSTTDVVTIGGVAFLAGLQQAGDEYSEFGQGAQGYAKRFGAAYGDAFASTFLSGAVFPSLFKQDVRYFIEERGQLQILRERVPEFPLSFHGVLVGSVADTAVADVVDVVLGRHLIFFRRFSR